jgi:hypothetical protein
MKFKYLNKIYELVSWWPQNFGQDRVCVNAIDDKGILITLYIPSRGEIFPNHNVKIIENNQLNQPTQKASG